jgi:hypothetical protein
MHLNQQEKFVAETLESGQLQTHKSTLIRADKSEYNSNSSNSNLKSKRLIVWFKLIKNNQEVVFVLKGQKAKTLKTLVENGSGGCNALEISKTFALRLSEYIRALRHDCLCGSYNLDIITNKEPNPTGWHGRYVLTDKVEILPNKPNDQEQS